MKDNENNEDKTLVLAVGGYELSITPHAERVKLGLLQQAALIISIDTPEACNVARIGLKELAAFRLDLERSRKLVKEPVLKLGKDIDTKAAEFGSEVEAEEERIKKLVADFAAEQERQRRQAEEDARKAKEEAERLKREAEQAEIDRQRAELEAERLKLEQEKKQLIAAQSPAAAVTGGGFLAKRRAEAEQRHLAEQAAAAGQRSVELKEQAEEQAAMASDAALASTLPAVAGVKPMLDFTVVDVAALYRHAPHLCTLIPNRSAILAALKQMQNANLTTEIPGLQVREVFKVSTR